MEDRKCPLTREQVKAYYAQADVQAIILDQCRNRFVAIRFDWGMLRHPSKNDIGNARRVGYDFVIHDGKPFITLTKAGSGGRPDDIVYWVSRGALEFIPEVSEYNDLDRSDFFVVDLDPKSPDFSFDDLRASTLKVLGRLKEWLASDSRFSLRAVEVRFSGNRSFHLYFRFNQKYDLTVIRDALKIALDPIDDVDSGLSYHNVRDRKDFILIDIGAVARHRCVRSLGSLHAKTGRRCIPLEESRISSFQPEEAIA